MRRSSATLKSSSLAQQIDDDVSPGKHSLAHELAAALMPEPSAGSRSLAEEFGIDYDEGAEGIDDDTVVALEANEPHPTHDANERDQSVVFEADPHAAQDVNVSEDDPAALGPASPASSRRDQSPMDILARDLESTDRFLSNLRRLDGDAGANAQPSLETLASEVIRRINETARDREEQVRELLGYEREFRKMSAEVGADDVLGTLEQLPSADDLSDNPSTSDTLPRSNRRFSLQPVTEEPLHTPTSTDWEVDPDHRTLGDGEDVDSRADSSQILKEDSFPSMPPVQGPITPSKTLPHFAHLRAFTTSVVSSLTTLSEQVQVNGASTTEAGRKIRAVKNTLGGWKNEFESTERSVGKIERWIRPDVRRLVQEHLAEMNKALAETNARTQAIMAAS